MQLVGELVRLRAERLGGLPGDAQLPFELAQLGAVAQGRHGADASAVHGDRLPVQHEHALTDEHHGVRAGRRSR